MQTQVTAGRCSNEGEPQSGEEHHGGEPDKAGADLEVLLLDCDVLRQVREHGVQLFGIGGLEVLAAGRRGHGAQGVLVDPEVAASAEATAPTAAATRTVDQSAELVPGAHHLRRRGRPEPDGIDPDAAGRGLRRRFLRGDSTRVRAIGEQHDDLRRDGRLVAGGPARTPSGRHWAGFLLTRFHPRDVSMVPHWRRARRWRRWT
jgi:hypothetical protein